MLIANLKDGDLFGFLAAKVKDFFLLGAPSTCLVFLSIKVFKTWYQKQEDNQQLLKANTDAEIQILKAQVHPHFLFNTLNNIYSFILNKSPRSKELVLQLSEMLRYMITECNSKLVLLEKELKILHDYIELERIRYGNNLNLQIEITGNTKHKLIAPLLLIPFIENAFKHGASKMLDHPWIKLKIVVENDQLFFDIENNKLTQGKSLNTKTGIGLKNVEKRLALLYPDQHTLNIVHGNDIFSVRMQVPLSEAASYDAIETNQGHQKISALPIIK